MKIWARHTRICLFTLAATVGLSLPSAASAGTLDQQQTANDGMAFGLGQQASDAQTFTAGITGGLDEVDLDLARVGTPLAYATVEIRDVSGGSPGQAILAARSLPPSAVTNTTAQFIPVQFNPPAPVVTGTQYAIVAYSGNPAGNWYIWEVKLSDVYLGGQAFNSVTAPPSSWVSDSTNDLAFKTYVVPAPPPTPSAGPTGQRAAALAQCKKRARKHNWSKKRLKQCKRKANLLPL